MGRHEIKCILRIRSRGVIDRHSGNTVREPAVVATPGILPWSITALDEFIVCRAKLEVVCTYDGFLMLEMVRDVALAELIAVPRVTVSTLPETATVELATPKHCPPAQKPGCNRNQR
jgi:hypothetical protein